MAEPPRFRSLPDAGMWASFKLDCQYCWASLKLVAVEHDWSSAMKALLTIDKGLKEFIGGGFIFLVCNFVYFYFVFPVVGVAWTVAIYLALVCAFLWVGVHAARIRHEIKRTEYNDALGRFGTQLSAAVNRNEEIRSDKLAQEAENESLRVALTEARAEIAHLKQRPEITGGFHDLQTTYYYGDTVPDLDIPRPIGTQVVISGWLRNNNPTPTTLHNFRLEWGVLGKTWIADYAEEITIHEDRDIWPTSEIARRNAKMQNLSGYLGTKSFTKDIRVEGYWVFRLAGHGFHVEGLKVEDLPAEGWPISITLYIEDAWGTEHIIRDPMFTTGRPSLRLSKRSSF